MSRHLRSSLLAGMALIALGVPATAAAQTRAGEPEPAPTRTTAATSSATSTATVRAAQRRLGVRADGVVGPRTRRAIKRFQRRRGLEPDGVLGPATLRALGVKASTRRARPRGGAPSAAALEQIAQCESGGNPRAVSPDGRYRGKYQFSRATWESVGGTGDPAEAAEAEQDRLAALLSERQAPSAWPSCAR